MLSIVVNGEPLKLRGGTEASVEHVPPLFADGIEDSYSTPVEVPAEGNEQALGHVHELSLAKRELVLDNAELHHAGLRLALGELLVLASTPSTVRMSFTLDAFVSAIRGVMLPDTLMQEVIDRLQEQTEDSIDLATRPAYVDGGKCQFPMFLNPSQYGDERPSWNPSASAWDEDRAYAENDLVSFTLYTAIERTYVYQCTDAGGTVAGESPVTDPGKWRRTSFGLVNAWDEENNQHYLNEVGSDFYTLVPWFYAKWVIKTALLNLGFTVKGNWMDDTATHELLIANTTTIDSVSEPDPDYGFHVRQNSIVYYTPGDAWEDYRIVAQDESTTPLQDGDGMWDNSAMKWTCPAAGEWRFRLTLRMNRSVIDIPDVFLSTLRVVMFGAGNVVRAEAQQYFAAGQDIFAIVDLLATMEAGDVAADFHFAARQTFGDTTLWPAGEGDHYTYAAIRGWREVDVPTVCVPDQIIYPHRHVPNMELGAFLVAWCDAYNLRFTADMQDRVVYLDRRELDLLHLEANSTDQTHRAVGPAELDHERRTTGMRLSWDVDDNVAEEEPNAPELSYYSENDLPAPTSVGQVALVRSTRKFLRSVFVSGSFVWRSMGYHVPPVLRGDPEEAVDVTPALRPLHMEQVTLDGHSYLVPVLDEQGTSSFFHGKGQQDTLYVTEFKKSRSSDNEVTNVPMARSWGYGWNDADRSATTLIWENPDVLLPGMYQRCWQAWISMILNAEPVTRDLLLDMPFLLSKDWQRAMHIAGHRYLCQRLPVTYRTDRADLVSRGAYLLKLHPYHPQPLGRLVPSFLFTNIEPGDIEIYTNTGYVTLENEVGERYTYETSDPPTGYISVPLATTGNWRAWSSDQDGNFQGRLRLLQIYTSIMSAANLAGLTTLEGLVITGSLITSLNLTGCTSLNQVIAIDCAIADVDVVFNALNTSLSGIYVSIVGGTSAAPTAASLPARTAILANGGTIFTN